MRISVPVAATAAFLFCASTSASAADYTGFWKGVCTDPFGISIKPDADKTYSISFCGPGGCGRWKPNTTIDGDPLYQVVDADTLDVRASATEPWRRFKKCTTDTNPKLEFATAQAQAQPSPPAQAKPSSSGLNPLWFGTWKSEDGTASVTISRTKMVHTFQEKDPDDGSPRSRTFEHSWTESTDTGEEAFGYGADRTSPDKIAERYEEAVRKFKKDPTDFGISDPTTSRRAIAAISPGVYRVLWNYYGGDCYYWEYILDRDRMLEISECKYGFEVVLYNRATAR